MTKSGGRNTKDRQEDQQDLSITCQQWGECCCSCSEVPSSSTHLAGTYSTVLSFLRNR